MKKLILKLFVFAITLMIIFLYLTYFYRGEVGHTRSNICGYYAEKKNTIDVVLVGTSTTFSSFLPMKAWKKHGYTSYIFSSNFQLEETLPFSLCELYKTQNPRVLVIDIAPFILGHRAEVFKNTEHLLRYNTDGFNNSLNRFKLINHIIPKETNKFNYYFDFFFYHNNGFAYTYPLNKKHSFTKGYNSMPWQVSYVSQNDFIMDRRPLEQKDLENFATLLEALKQYEADILFINQPTVYAYNNFKNPEEIEILKKQVLAQGFDFLDMTEHYAEIGLDGKTDYSLDSLHYNVYGAEKITNFLAQHLKNRYFQELPIKDERTIQEWNNDYKEWEKLHTLYQDEIQQQWAAKQ